MIDLWPLLVLLLLSSVVYISLCYIFGFLYLKRIDLLDSFWGIGFVYLALITYFLINPSNFFSLASLLLVCIWGIRLFWHITSRNIKKPEDERYKKYREKYKQNLNINVYFKLFLSQGLLIWIVSLAAIGAIASDEYKAIPAFIGLAIWLFGIIFEATADHQLKVFLKTKKPGEIMTSGLYKYTRHPNYFGEVALWVGAAIVAISAGNYWGIIGAAVISYLILKVSGVPLLEKKYADNKAFQNYANKTSVFVPLPPKK